MKRAKRIFFIMQITTVIFYTVIYLLKSFVIWKFTNPFNWLIAIPSYDSTGRLTVLGILFIYYFFVIAFAVVATEPKKNKDEKKA